MVSETTDWVSGRQGAAIEPEENSADPYFGPSPAPQELRSVGSPEPQAFLARLGGQREIRAHFHAVDQFQFVVQGRARLAAHDVTTGALHYADRFQPYGPIRPAPEGLAYVTLRRVTEAGAFFMPESRAELAEGLTHVDEPPTSRRNFTIDVVGAESGSDGAWTVLFDADDQLRVAVVDLTPGTRAPALDVTGDGGYLLVVSGSVRTATDELPPGSIRQLAPGSSTEEIETGPVGARVALAQLPVRGIAGSDVHVPA